MIEVIIFSVIVCKSLCGVRLWIAKGDCAGSRGNEGGRPEAERVALRVLGAPAGQRRPTTRHRGAARTKKIKSRAAQKKNTKKHNFQCKTQQSQKHNKKVTTITQTSINTLKTQRIKKQKHKNTQTKTKKKNRKNKKTNHQNIHTKTPEKTTKNT